MTRLVNATGMVVMLTTATFGTFGHSVVAAASALSPRLIYQAHWQHGKLGWSSFGESSWQTVNRQLLFDGSGTSVILAPPNLRNHSSYAVEARIQTLGHDSYNGNSGFGIIVRAYGPVDLYPDNGPFSGITIGVQRREGYTDYHPNGSFVSAWASGVYPEPLATSDFEPGGSWHTYRVESKGNQLKLLVDGQLALRFRSNKFLAGARIGLFSIYSEISVKAFKVFAP